MAVATIGKFDYELMKAQLKKIFEGKAGEVGCSESSGHNKTESIFEASDGCGVLYGNSSKFDCKSRYNQGNRSQNKQSDHYLK